MHFADTFIQSDLNKTGRKAIYQKEPTIFLIYNGRFIQKARKYEKCKEKVNFLNAIMSLFSLLIIKFSNQHFELTILFFSSLFLIVSDVKYYIFFIVNS